MFEVGLTILYSFLVFVQSVFLNYFNSVSGCDVMRNKNENEIIESNNHEDGNYRIELKTKTNIIGSSKNESGNHRIEFKTKTKIIDSNKHEDENYNIELKRTRTL